MEDFCADYEEARLKRYEGFQSEEHDELLFVAGYIRWAKTPPSPRDTREKTWDEYCDIRDSVPVGTNQTIRHNQQRKLQ